jgi:hypothetical protein
MASLASARPSRWLAASAIAAALGWAPSTRAQISALQEPAHLAVQDGSVTLEREGQREEAVANIPLVAGDRLTTARGRAELQFPDGSILDLDEYTSLELLSATVLRLTAGRALLTVADLGDPAGVTSYQIHTPAASVRTDSAGEFRLDVSDRRGLATEIFVRRGAATLWTDRGSLALRAGERSEALADGVPSAPELVNSARLDAFDQWSAERHRERVAGLSAQYLPRELRPYGSSFDQDGAWRNVSPYGYVWYPTVAADWRPYYDGYWSPLSDYGWVWIGLGRWAWPTHHFGRWGRVRGSWFWIPGRRWSAAWVSWGAAPGYVSWCPLGFDGRPAFGLSPGTNERWRGWVVVPRQSFGSREHVVRQYAIAPQALGVSTPFITQAAAPVAIPRQAVGRSPASVGGKLSVVTPTPVQTLTRPRVDHGRRLGTEADRRTDPTRKPQPAEVHRLGGRIQTVQPAQPVRTAPGASIRTTPQDVTHRVVLPAEPSVPVRVAPPPLARIPPSQQTAPTVRAAPPVQAPAPHPSPQAPRAEAPHAQGSHESRRAK